MIELIGNIGLVALLLSGLPQLFKTVREGHAEGLSIWFLITMNIGFLGMLSYVVCKHGFEDKPLVIDYIFQLLVWLTVFSYKLYPRTK